MIKIGNIIEFIQDYYAPVLMVVLGFFVGFLAEKIIIKRLIKFSARTKWKSDDILFRSMRNLVWPLFFIGGIYLALHNTFGLPEKYKHIGDAVVSVSYILIISIYFSRILSKFIHVQTFDEQKQGTSTILTNLVKTVIISVGAMIALQSLGISIQPLLTALGITGLAVALALQGTLSNFFSGLQIIASKRFSPGDFIRIDQNIEGYISDINWRSTTIQQLSNNIVIIPNAKLADAIVVNTFLPDTETYISISCNLSYDNDLEKAEAVALDLAAQTIPLTDGCVADARPDVRFQSFEESYIKFNLNIRIKSYTDQYLVKHTFIKMIHKRFKEEGIKVASPAKVVLINE